MEFKRAICYSGYRTGQQPKVSYPSYEQVKEDLSILEPNFDYLRLYDCTVHAETVLRVIENENMKFKVLLGANIEAEVNNPNCPWGSDFTKEQLIENRRINDIEIELLIELAIRYKDLVLGVSVGNEATVDWNDHMIPVERVIDNVKKVKSRVNVPVTFCENYLPWITRLDNLACELDFISIHTYPVWEYKNIDEALSYTIENFNMVSNKYPDKTIVITEAGWTTNSNGRGITPENANQEFQRKYCKELWDWSKNNKVTTFMFEAFDEEWKGSDDNLEPEKHWGIYKSNRKPKLVVNSLF